MAITIWSGGDSFWVDRKAGNCVGKLQAEGYELETIQGPFGKKEEIINALKQFHEAVSVPSLFADKKVVWLRHASLNLNNASEKAEDVLEWWEQVLTLAQSEGLDGVDGVVSFDVLDKRSGVAKKLAKQPFYKALDGGKKQDDPLGKLRLFIQELGLNLDSHAERMLLDKTGGNNDVLYREIEKLVTYANGESLNAEDIDHLVATTAEGDFFEASEAFYQKNVSKTLLAIDRYFAENAEGRPLLAALQKKNRLLIQAKLLKGAPKVEDFYTRIGLEQELQPEKKSNVLIAGQNPWYAKRLVEAANKFSLKELIQIQKKLFEVYPQMLAMPNNQKMLFKEFVLGSIA